MSEHLVHDAVGGPLSGVEAGAALGVGINSLLVLGVLPVLLGALVDEHRLDAAGIGQAAMLELLSMGVSTALFGMLVKPRRLKLIGVLTSVALAGVNLASAHAGGLTILALRAGAGALEGVLLWITVGMIARTVTPERWAGVFFTGQVLAQLALAVAFAVTILPRFGAAGGFVSLAAVSLLGVIPALVLPGAYAPLPLAEGESGAPPLRGWIALAATLIYVSAGGAVGVYLEPLAHRAGLDAGVARTALWVSLAAQVAGGAAATALAGRIRYFAVFLITSSVSLTGWYVFSATGAAWLFIAANAALGLFALFLGPFLVPMTIDADPSRRAAVQSGAAQLLGGALGPWLASLVVTDAEPRGALVLAAALMSLGLAGVAWLRFTADPPQASSSMSQ